MSKGLASFMETFHNNVNQSTNPANNKPIHSDPYIVVVTGAGKGIGYAICVAYARAGATGLVISSRTRSDLDKLSKELLSINPDLEVVIQTCDTSSPEQVKALADATNSKFPNRLDVVISNAGVASRLFQDPNDNNVRRLPRGILEDEDFAWVTNVNYLGTFYMAKFFTPLLLSKTNSSPLRAFVVNSSEAALLAESQYIPVSYNVSKIAVNRLVEHMANDYKGNGLQAFCLHPGEVKTAMTQPSRDTGSEFWTSVCNTDVNLCGGFMTWLTKERRDWLSGRLLSAHWDVEELERRKDEIVEGDKLKMKLQM